MLNKEYATMLFDGVELSKMTRGQLQSKKTELTNVIIRVNNSLESIECPIVGDYCDICYDRKELVKNTQQSLDIIQSEINSRYSEMQTFR